MLNTDATQSYFAIQAGGPRLSPGLTVEVDLHEAVEEVFLSQTEDMILIWNHVPVRVSYKYDLSVVIEDLLEFLHSVLEQPEGASTLHLISNTLRGSWSASWTAGEIGILSQWECVSGGYESVLNQRPSLRMSREGFLREWAQPLGIVSAALRSRGAVGASDLVEAVVALLPGLGRFYRPVGQDPS